MNYQEIYVPKEFKYLSDWHDLLNDLPQKEKYILNKVTMFKIGPENEYFKIKTKSIIYCMRLSKIRFHDNCRT